MKKRETKIFTCPLCNDYEGGQEKAFNRHLKSVHNTDSQTLYLNQKRAKNILVHNTCRCGCGQPTKWQGWHIGYSEYLRGHNASVDTVFTDKEFIKNSSEKKKAAGVSSWNKGLTKETSEKMAEMASKTSTTLNKLFSSGDYVSWQMSDPEKAAAVKAKTAATKKKLFASGELIPWNKGLTSETSEIIASNAQKISEKFASRQAGKRLSEQEVADRVDKLGFMLVSQQNYQQRKTSSLEMVCKVCNSNQLRTLYSIEQSEACFVCKPKESKPQIEIFDFVRAISPDAVMEDRQLISPKELDILVPSRKFAIEFNGLHWHSERYVSKTHHSDKTAVLSALGYRLFHIFEDEWRDKRPIVESMILNRLGQTPTRIGARQCNIVSISPARRKIFFDANHLDGDVKAQAAFGLEYQGELVACISLRRPFHKKWSDRLEVARFACGLNTQISGALSRLTKRAEIFAKSVGKTGLLSYIDLRLANSDGYLRSGWQYHHTSTNTFWWTDNFNRFNRFAVRADKKSGVTQEKSAKQSGVSKIWGCPQCVMLY